MSISFKNKNEGKMTQQNEKKHLDWIDWVRCLAICTVILIHVLQDTYSYELDVLPYAGTGRFYFK